LEKGRVDKRSKVSIAQKKSHRICGGKVFSNSRRDGQGL